MPEHTMTLAGKAGGSSPGYTLSRELISFGDLSEIVQGTTEQSRAEGICTGRGFIDELSEMAMGK